MAFPGRVLKVSAKEMALPLCYLGDSLTVYRRHHSCEATLIGLWRTENVSGTSSQYPLNGHVYYYLLFIYSSNS